MASFVPANLAYPVRIWNDFRYDNPGGDEWRGDDIMTRTGIRQAGISSSTPFDIIVFQVSRDMGFLKRDFQMDSRRFLTWYRILIRTCPNRQQL